MKLSSAYLAERLRERYDVLTCENISGEDAYFRPFLQTRDVAPARGRVCIVTGTYLKQRQSTIQIQKAKYNWDDVLVILTESDQTEEFRKELSGPYIMLNPNISASDVINTVQRIFDRCDDWVEQLNALVLRSGSIQRALKLSADMVGNPLVVMGIDFTLTAESKGNNLSQGVRLFTDEMVNLEYMNAYIQDETYKKSIESEVPMLLPAFINGVG